MSTQLANSQAIRHEIIKGSANERARIKARLLDCSPKTNHCFCPPLRTQADADKSGAIYKAF